MVIYKKKGFHYELAHISDKVTKLSLIFSEKLLRVANKVVRAWQSFFNIEKGAKGFKVARFLTYPFGRYIWVGIWKKITKKQYERITTDEDGLHVIGGNTGSGKSSLSFELAERDKWLSGKCWYFNSEIEKPRFDVNLNAKVRHHKLLPFENVWSDWKTHLQLDTRKFAAYAIDEFHRIFDYRQNRSYDYLSRFEPFRDYAVVSRKHIKRLFGITQMDRLDIQLMYLVKYWHKPRIDIGFDAEDWMHKTGLFRFKPLGWYIDTYVVDTSNPSSFLVPHKSWYLKQEYADFDYYDTYAYSDDYNHLPVA